ncbi:unnamed protein product [Closterium sp. Naga37s-1]|nr:unnamed protein product [Closterium sp. Naga37s-1]
MANVLAIRSEVTGKPPIKMTPKMQGAGGLGTRLSGGVKKRKTAGGRLIQNVHKDGGDSDRDDVDNVAGNTTIVYASAAAADPSSDTGDAAPLGVQVHADDFSDEEHDEEEERTKTQKEMIGDGRQDMLNNITERDGASLPSQSPAESPLEGVAAASDQAANGWPAELERTTQQQPLLISSLLEKLNNGSCSNLEKGAVGPASGGVAVLKKMELAVVVAFFRQPDDVTSVYPSESVVMRCLIGVWGESKAAALAAVMMYCVARAGASTRKQSDCVRGSR